MCWSEVSKIGLVSEGIPPLILFTLFSLSISPISSWSKTTSLSSSSSSSQFDWLTNPARTEFGFCTAGLIICASFCCLVSWLKIGLWVSLLGLFNDWLKFVSLSSSIWVFMCIGEGNWEFLISFVWDVCFLLLSFKTLFGISIWGGENWAFCLDCVIFVWLSTGCCDDNCLMLSWEWLSYDLYLSLFRLNFSFWFLIS